MKPPPALPTSSFKSLTDLSARGEDLQVAVNGDQIAYRWRSERAMAMLHAFLQEFRKERLESSNFKVEKPLSPKVSYYHLGTVTCFRTSKQSSDVSRLDVLDGQHRLTTVFLITYALCIQASGDEVARNAEQMRKILADILLVRVSANDRRQLPRFFWQSSENLFLRDLFQALCHASLGVSSSVALSEKTPSSANKLTGAWVLQNAIQSSAKHHALVMDLLGSKNDINESSKNIIVNLMSLVAELHRMRVRGETKALQDFAFWVKTRVMINLAVVNDAGMAADFCRQANALQGLPLAPEDHLRMAFQYSTRNIGSTSGEPSAHSQLLKLGILLQPFSREIRSRLLNAALSAINESMSEAEEIAQGVTVSPSRLFLELTRDSSGMYKDLQLLEELRAVTRSMIVVRFPERGSIPPPNLLSENAAHQRKLAQLLAIMTTLRKYFQHLDGVLAFGLKEVKACLDADEAGLAQLRFVSLVARFCLLQVLQPEPWTEFHFIFVARRFLRGVRFALGNKKGFARLAGLLHFTCKHFGISTDMRAEFLKYLSSPTLYVDVCERPGQKQALIFALLLADAELVTPTKVQTRAYATCDFSLEHVDNKAVSGALWFHGLGNLCVIRDDANVSLHNTSFQEKVSFFDPNVGKAKSLIRGPLPGVSWLAKHVVAQSSSHIFPAWGSNHAKDLFTQNLYSICEALRIFTCSNFEMNVFDDRMLKDVGGPPKQMSRGLVTSLFSAGSLVKDPDAARASLDQVIKIAREGLPQTPASLARRPSSWLPWKPTQHFEMVDKLQALHSLASLTNIECAGLLADALDPLLKKTRGKKSSRSSMSLKMLAQEYLGRAQCGDSDAARTLLSFLRAQFSAKVRAQHQLPSGRDDKIGPWKVISLGDVAKISEKDAGIQLVPNFTAEFMLFGLQFMVKLLPHQGNFYIQLWQLNRDGSKARDLGSFPHPDPAQKKLEDVGRNTPDVEMDLLLAHTLHLRNSIPTHHVLVFGRKEVQDAFRKAAKESLSSESDEEMEPMVQKKEVPGNAVPPAIRKSASAHLASSSSSASAAPVSKRHASPGSNPRSITPTLSAGRSSGELGKRPRAQSADFANSDPLGDIDVPSYDEKEAFKRRRLQKKVGAKASRNESSKVQGGTSGVTRIGSSASATSASEIQGGTSGVTRIGSSASATSASEMQGGTSGVTRIGSSASAIATSATSASITPANYRGDYVTARVGNGCADPPKLPWRRTKRSPLKITSWGETSKGVCAIRAPRGSWYVFPDGFQFEYTYALPDSYSPAPKRTQVILSGLFSYENDRISYKLWDRDSPSNVEEKATLTGLFEAVATKALGIDELPGQKKGAPQRFRLNDILDVVMKSWKVTPKEVEDAVGLASSHSSRAPALSDSHAPTPAGTDTSLKRPTQGTSSKASPDDSGDDPAERNAVEALMQSRTPPELPSQIPVVAVSQAPQEIAENREQKIPSSTSANASASASASATSATATGQDSTSRNGPSSQSSTAINNNKKKNKKKKKKSDSKKPVVYELIDDSSADESDESSSDGDKSDDGDADYDPDVANPDDSDSSGLSDIDLPGVKD